jgi:hypothetical protein
LKCFTTLVTQGLPRLAVRRVIAQLVERWPRGDQRRGGGDVLDCHVSEDKQRSRQTSQGRAARATDLEGA